MFQRRISLKQLASFCRRMALALDSGLSVRNTLEREARGWLGGGSRRPLMLMAQETQRGNSLAEAMTLVGNYFPPLVRDLVTLGEQSGHLPEVFRQLADYYEQRVRMRRALLSRLTWPAIQLTLALSIVGALIVLTKYINEQIKQFTNTRIDILGLGLEGFEGLTVYLTVLASIALVGWLLFAAAQRGAFWITPIQAILMRAPMIGKVLQTLALARFAWALRLTYNAGMSLPKALPLCLRATGSGYYARHGEVAAAQIVGGDEISEALASTRVFPEEFLEALEVGEKSGRVGESMGVLAEQYREQAELSLATLNVFIGFGVWLIMAGIIIVIIFRVFSFYVGQINALL